MSGAFGMASGELLAVDVPLGPAWIGVVHRCWSEGVAFLPIDPRWTKAERRRVLERAQPAAVLDAAGDVTVFGGAAPVDPGIAVVIATSGTAGVPKLAELPRAAVEAAVRGSDRALDAGGDQPASPTVWHACLTPAHVGGSLVLLRGEILGVRLVLADRFEPEAVQRLLRDRSPAAVALVPSMLTRLLEDDVPLPDALLLVGGGAVDEATVGRAESLGARVVSTYGMTETCGGVVYDGVPFEGMDVRVTPGAEPSIELRGPTLFAGYRGDPGATGAAFDSRGWFRTHDLGSIDDDGRLHVWGRADDAIRTGGETVWPEEVEAILRGHEGVRDVAVAGRPHATWGQEVVAFIVPADPGMPPGSDELKAWVREHVAPFKAPRRTELVDAIPRTRSGKIVRRELPR